MCFFISLFSYRVVISSIRYFVRYLCLFVLSFCMYVVLSFVSCVVRYVFMYVFSYGGRSCFPSLCLVCYIVL